MTLDKNTKHLIVAGTAAIGAFLWFARKRPAPAASDPSVRDAVNTVDPAYSSGGNPSLIGTPGFDLSQWISKTLTNLPKPVMPAVPTYTVSAEPSKALTDVLSAMQGIGGEENCGCGTGGSIYNSITTTEPAPFDARNYMSRGYAPSLNTPPLPDIPAMVWDSVSGAYRNPYKPNSYTGANLFSGNW